MRAYIAGPLFNEHEREYLEKINKVCISVGISTFLPHRDAGTFEDKTNPILIFDADICGLLGCDIIIALLDGQDIDSGTCVELGIAWANKLRVVGITTDTIRREYSNAMPIAICMMSMGVVHSTSELYSSLVQII